MAIIFNDNIRINAGKPVDAKYLNTGNTSYATISEVNNTIVVPERHIGMTVNIAGDEYWYKSGVTDSDLVEKLSNSSSSGTITGATNLGFFSGTSGVQTLEVGTKAALPVPNHLEYRGLYSSVLGYYYRDDKGIIRVGVSEADSVPKRLYVKTTTPVKSLIWSDLDDGVDGLRGWFLMDGDASLRIGEEINLGFDGVDYYGTTGPYTNFTWSTPLPNIGFRSAFITDVFGDLNTGQTTTLGTPVYSQLSTDGTRLELRTIRSITPNRINVDFDNTFINLSASTISGENIGSTIGTFGNVYSGVDSSGNVLRFRRLRGAGDTVISTSGDDIIINSVAGGSGIAFADNGLNLSGNTVVLGGDLTGDTVITGSDYTHSIEISGMNGLKLEAFDLVLSNNANFAPARYDGDYFTNPSLITSHSIPDIQYVTGITSNLQTQINNIVIGGNISGATNIGSGVGLYSGNITSNQLEFRSIVGSGSTNVSLSGDTVIINSVGGSGSGTTNITASNGLSLSGNTVVLGGTLTGNTEIDASSNELSIIGIGNFTLKTDDNHEISFNDEAGFELTGNTYVFRDTSLITKEYVDNIRTNNVSGVTYQATTDDDFIEVSGGSSITLPANPVKIGKRIIVADVSGNAELNPIIVLGGDNNILNNSSATINTDYGSLTFIYNSLGFWSITGFSN